MSLNYYVETTFHFKCPTCKQRHTKRTGTTSQINPKARILCYTCRELSKKINPTLEDEDKKIRPFFTLTYEQMKKEIEESNLNDEKKKFFLEKYKI